MKYLPLHMYGVSVGGSWVVTAVRGRLVAAALAALRGISRLMLPLFPDAEWPLAPPPRPAPSRSLSPVCSGSNRYTPWRGMRRALKHGKCTGNANVFGCNHQTVCKLVRYDVYSSFSICVEVKWRIKCNFSGACVGVCEDTCIRFATLIGSKWIQLDNNA